MPTVGYAPTTNLRVQIDTIRARLAEPFEAADAAVATEGYFRQIEIVDYIHQSEIKVAQDLPNDALTGLLTVLEIMTVDGTDIYRRPGTDISEFDDTPILRLVSLDLDTGAGLFPCQIVGRQNLWMSDNTPTHRATAMRPRAAFDDDGNIIVRPVPGAEAGAAMLIYRYIRIPRRRYKHYRGTVTTGTSATMFEDTAAPYPSDYWNTDGVSTVRFMDGTLEGEERTILDWTGPSDLYELAHTLSIAPTVGDAYVAGETSDLGAEFNPMVIAYSVYQGMQKQFEEGQANIALGEYNQLLQMMTQKYTDLRQMTEARP